MPTRGASRKGIYRLGIDALTLNAVLKLFADPTVHHYSRNDRPGAHYQPNDFQTLPGVLCQPSFDYCGDYSR